MSFYDIIHFSTLLDMSRIIMWNSFPASAANTMQLLINYWWKPRIWTRITWLSDDSIFSLKTVMIDAKYSALWANYFSISTAKQTSDSSLFLPSTIWISNPNNIELFSLSSKITSKYFCATARAIVNCISNIMRHLLSGYSLLTVGTEDTNNSVKIICLTLYIISLLFTTSLFSRPSKIQEVVRGRPSNDTPFVKVSTMDLRSSTPIG